MACYTVVRQQMGPHSFNQMWRVAAREETFIVYAVSNQVTCEFGAQFICDTLSRRMRPHSPARRHHLGHEATYL